MSTASDYDYELPRHLIAQQPLASRVDARLMLVDRATAQISHHHVRDLPELLRPGDCLVLNDTKVIPARLVGYRTLTGGRWEGLYLAADAHGNWKLLGKSRGHIKPGETVTLVAPNGSADVTLRLLLQQAGGVWIARPATDEDPLAILNRVGRVPLPPYIRRNTELESDRHRYQTVFAQIAGAVAAPTAGLHFSEELLTRLKTVGVRVASVTLHVGIDTFRPIAVDTLGAHKMHSEWGRVSPEAAETLAETRASGGRIVAVGTTAVRLLESAAAGGAVAPWTGDTDLFIRPPYKFRAVNAMLTNFHLPRTTLLVLVRTFGGAELIRQAYEEAVHQHYRFYSYGDAMLIV